MFTPYLCKNIQVLIDIIHLVCGGMIYGLYQWFSLLSVERQFTHDS